MRDFISLLSGFYQATKQLSEETYESASIVMPIFQSLKYWLTPNEKAPPDSIPQLKTLEGKDLRSALYKSLDFYVKKYKLLDNDLLKAITYLDPRYIYKIEIIFQY